MDTKKAKVHNKDSKSHRKTSCKTCYKAKKEKIDYGRGLLDVLDVHACAGSEVRLSHSYENSYEGGRPYVPSAQSMPLSSISDDSFSHELQSRVKNHQRVNKHLSPVSESGKDSNNTNFNEHLYLDGDKMLTDDSRDILWEGDQYPTKEMKPNAVQPLADILPEKSDNTLALELEEELDSSPHSTVAFSGLKVKENKEAVQKVKEATCEKTVTATSEEYTIVPEVFSSVKVNNEMNIENVDQCLKKSNLRLFDCNKYPLTDSNGNILKNASGKYLVIMRNGQPHLDCYKRPLYDQNGESSSSLHFKPYASSKSSSDIISKINLYDFRGYPLTDYNGSSLIAATGKTLIVTDQNGKLLHDVNGNPIFDGAGIPLTKTGESWLNPRGTPYRVFDKNQYPLTDNYGRVILKKNKEELLRVDEYGRPIFDYNGEHVFDASGHAATDPKFNPTMPEENDDDNIVVVIGNMPVQIYDKDDFPLTNAHGIVLKDSCGKYILSIDLLNNIDLSDTSRTSNVTGKLKLRKLSDFSKYKKELKTTRDLSKRNRYASGNISSTGSETCHQPIEDTSADLVSSDQAQNTFIDATDAIYLCGRTSETIPTDLRLGEENSICKSIRDFASDTSANQEYTSDSPTNSDNSESELQEYTVTRVDVFGRPLYDREGKPIFDKYGRPLLDLFSRPIYDKRGHPIATEHGKLMKDGKEENPGVPPGFDINYLKLHDPEKLLDLRDRNGGPIHDGSGRPLYNENGKPLYDAYGRPMYDESGYPLCDKKGFPASKVVQEKGLRIKDVADSYQKLCVYSQLQDPHRFEGSVRGGNGITQNELLEVCFAKVRITSFVNKERVMELLELLPSS